MERNVVRLRAYAFGHFAVDFACFYVLYINVSQNDILPFFLLYNAVAFALQPLWGALADRIDDPRPLAVIGLALAAAGTFVNALPIPAMLLCAMGNAIYHPAGAAVALRGAPSDMRAAGIYVAPGALGTALGMLAGESLAMPEPLMLTVMLVAVIFVWAVGAGATRREAPEASDASPLAVVLCLVSIALRSFVGALAVGMPNAIIVTALAVYFGKRIGGSLTSRIPAYILAPVSVLSGTLLMAFFPAAWGTVAGLFLFNLAMPLTLGRVMGAMPRSAGLGFGLTALCLVAGAVPLAFIELTPSPALFVACGAFTAAMLIFGLVPRSKRTADSAVTDETENTEKEEAENDAD